MNFNFGKAIVAAIIVAIIVFIIIIVLDNLGSANVHGNMKWFLVLGAGFIAFLIGGYMKKGSAAAAFPMGTSNIPMMQ